MQFLIEQSKRKTKKITKTIGRMFLRKKQKRRVRRMKIVWISAFLLGCLMGFSIGVDMMQGFSFSMALQNAYSPFRVMEFAELFVLFFLLFCFVAEVFYRSFKVKKAKQRQK
jgi:Sec-independent protein secretion pathway component TatC